MIKTVCAKFRKQNHPNNALFVFLLTRGRLFVTKWTFLHTLSRFLGSNFVKKKFFHKVQSLILIYTPKEAHSWIFVTGGSVIA